MGSWSVTPIAGYAACSADDHTELERVLERVPAGRLQAKAEARRALAGGEIADLADLLAADRDDAVRHEAQHAALRLRDRLPGVAAAALAGRELDEHVVAGMGDCRLAVVGLVDQPRL